MGSSGSKDTEKNQLVEKSETRNYDDKFKGPVEKRSCTDIICCLIFVICILGLLAVAVWSFAFGDIRRVVNPTDSKGRICGASEGVKDKKFLVFFDLMQCFKMGPAAVTLGCPTPQVCVAKCPDYFWTWQTANSQESRSKMICLEGENGTSARFASQTVKSLVKSRSCAAYVLPTTSIVGRCMPDLGRNGSLLATLRDRTGEQLNGTTLERGKNKLNRFLGVTLVAQNVLNDLLKSWYLILIGLVIAMVLSLLWIFLLRCFAKVMVWITLLLFVVLFAFSTIYCFVRWDMLRKQEDKEPTVDLTLKVDSYFKVAKTWLIMGIISAVILAIVVLILIFLRSRIQIAIAIISETSRALSYMMSALLWPVVPFLLQLVVIGFTILVGLYLASVRAPEGYLTHSYDNLTAEAKARSEMQILASRIPCDPTQNSTGGAFCHFVKYGGKEYVTALQIFNVFMFFWMINFVIALGQITLAGAFASYYFTFKKPQDLPACPLINSFFRALRYHVGSLAFGSLLIAICQLIRALLEYVEAKARESQNVVAVFLVKCLKCCFWCLEKFLKFLTKNAYIMIAIYGQNFCSAAMNAFNLLARNIVRVFVVDKVSDYILFVGKLVVVGSTGLLAYFFFDGTLSSKSDTLKQMQPNLSYFYVPVIVVVVGSYVIAALFFSVYEMGVDTLFLCFLEDLERNDGSPEKPYYMNKELMEILGRKNVKVAPAEPGKADVADSVPLTEAPPAAPDVGEEGKK